MRRFLKPALTVAAAAAAAGIVMTAGSPFEGAPAAKTKTITCATTPSTIGQGINSKKLKVNTIPLPSIALPTLPSIPYAQIPCDRLTQLPPGLQELPGKLQEVGARVQNILFPTTTTTEAPTTTTEAPTTTTEAPTTTTTINNS